MANTLYTEFESQLIIAKLNVSFQVITLIGG